MLLSARHTHFDRRNGCGWSVQEGATYPHAYSHRGKMKSMSTSTDTSIRFLFCVERGTDDQKKTTCHCRIQLIIWKIPLLPAAPPLLACVLGLAKVSTQEGAPLGTLFNSVNNAADFGNNRHAKTYRGKTCSPQKFNTHKHIHTSGLYARMIISIFSTAKYFWVPRRVKMIDSGRQTERFWLIQT